jgi:hypothetical protein
VIEHLPNIQKALDSIHITAKKKKKSYFGAGGETQQQSTAQYVQGPRFNS